jgi:ABC-2 type transport system permease protein
MSALSATRQIVVTEMKLVWRDPAGVFLPLALPLLIIFMHGLGGDDDDVAGPDGDIPAASAIGIPVGFATIVAILALVNVPSFLAAYRKDGVLRRLAVTPARPAMVLVAQVLVNVLLGLVGTVIALCVVALSFELVGPRLPGWAVVSALLLTAALYGLGLVISALAPSSSAATAIGLVAFLVLLTLGGGTVPVDALPPVLADIGRWLPFGAGSEALQDAWVGQTPAAADLAVLTVTAMASTALAVRIFRWE